MPDERRKWLTKAMEEVRHYVAEHRMVRAWLDKLTPPHGEDQGESE